MIALAKRGAREAQLLALAVVLQTVVFIARTAFGQLKGTSGAHYLNALAVEGLGVDLFGRTSNLGHKSRELLRVVAVQAPTIA